MAARVGRTVLIVAGLAVSASGLGAGTTLAAPVAHQGYSISEFDTIRLSAPVEVVVTTGKGVSADGIGDRDTLDALLLDMSGTVLTVRMRGGVSLGGSGGRARAPTRITLSTNIVRRAVVMGPGSLTVDRLKGAQTEATVQGTGTLTIPGVESDRVAVGLLGAGTVLLGGKALDMTANVGGSGRLDTTALDVQRLRIDAEGSADAQVRASESATASANGTGRIVVTGKAQCTVRKTGSASISCGGEVY